MLSFLLWTAACMVWKNYDSEIMRDETISACIFRPLVHLSMLRSDDESEESQLKKIRRAACWLLCSFVRAVPNYSVDLFSMYTNLSEKQHLLEDDRPEFSPNVLWALARICQSSVAVSELQSTGRLSRLIHRASLHCQGIVSSFIYFISVV